MPPDLLPLFLGTAYACLGLSGLRLTRLDGAGFGWTRLCVAGLSAAVLEWYALYGLTFEPPQPNDLVGSLLALTSLGALLEFSRRAVAHRLQLGPVAQSLAGLAIAALGIASLAATEGGIYDRLVFAQRSVGLTLAAISLLFVMPYRLRGALWNRGAGLALLLGLLVALALPSAWPLVPGVALAAIFLRVVYVIRHRDTQSIFAAWSVAEFGMVALLLLLAVLNAQTKGREVIRLEGLQFLRLTEAAAAALEPEDVGALQGDPSDLGSKTFEDVSRRLLAIQQLVRPASRPQTASRFAYLMAARDGRVVFLVDQPYEPEDPTAPGDPYDEASPELVQALSDGTPFLEGPLPDRYGTWVSAFAPVRDQSGQLLALLGIDFDAGDWAALEEAARLGTILNWTLLLIIALSIFTSVGLGNEAREQLKRSEQMFRTAADYVATWEYWVGPDGTMLHTSPACETITGYKPDALRRHPRRLLKIVHPDDRERVAEHLRSCRHDAPAGQFDFKIVRQDRSVAWISHSCQPVYDADGRWNGRRASNRDITNLRQAELTLARQERLQQGCQQGLRRLLGREGAAYVRDALEIAGPAGGCSCVALLRLAADTSLTPVETWPPGRAAICPLPWESVRARALPILSVGETFELLPRETRDLTGPMRGAHIAVLPLLEGGKLHGLVAFAAPPTREPWSRAELATLATLASGLSVALARG